MQVLPICRRGDVTLTRAHVLVPAAVANATHDEFFLLDVPTHWFPLSGIYGFRHRLEAVIFGRFELPFLDPPFSDSDRSGLLSISEPRLRVARCFTNIRT